MDQNGSEWCSHGMARCFHTIPICVQPIPMDPVRHLSAAREDPPRTNSCSHAIASQSPASDHEDLCVTKSIWKVDELRIVKVSAVEEMFRETWGKAWKWGGTSCLQLLPLWSAHLDTKGDNSPRRILPQQSTIQFVRCCPPRHRRRRWTFLGRKMWKPAVVQDIFQP